MTREELSLLCEDLAEVGLYPESHRAIAAMLRADAALADAAKEAVEEFAGKEGHARCWWYPELLGRLWALYFPDRPTPTVRLPPRAEFEAGCKRFADSEYAALAARAAPRNAGDSARG